MTCKGKRCTIDKADKEDVEIRVERLEEDVGRVRRKMERLGELVEGGRGKKRV